MIYKMLTYLTVTELLLSRFNLCREEDPAACSREMTALLHQLVAPAVAAGNGMIGDINGTNKFQVGGPVTRIAAMMTSALLRGAHEVRKKCANIIITSALDVQ